MSLPVFLDRTGVNFINVNQTNYSYKLCFGSFFHIHVMHM
jgi:hypothetical protein